MRHYWKNIYRSQNQALCSGVGEGVKEESNLNELKGGDSPYLKVAIHLERPLEFGRCNAILKEALRRYLFVTPGTITRRFGEVISCFGKQEECFADTGQTRNPIRSKNSLKWMPFNFHRTHPQPYPFLCHRTFSEQYYDLTFLTGNYSAINIIRNTNSGISKKSNSSWVLDRN